MVSKHLSLLKLTVLCLGQEKVGVGDTYETLAVSKNQATRGFWAHQVVKKIYRIFSIFPDKERTAKNLKQKDGLALERFDKNH